jgi:hypothetical protein
MKLQLDYSIKPATSLINTSNSIVSIGSCFAENIAQKMHTFLFKTLLNPNGIVFNPNAIFTQLNDCLVNNKITPNQLIQHDGLWHSLLHHGSFSGADKEQVIEKINQSTLLAHETLKNANYLMITFGSAWVYKYLPTKTFVSNNHKLDGNLFEKSLLKATDLKNEFDLFYQKLKQINPTIKLIFTVSPVRYIRDGLYENNVSKAVLHQLVYDIVSENKTDCYYFPAYEIVIDELRDYRFYKQDLVHPNQLAIDYVWQKFIENCMDENTKQYIFDFEKYLLLVNHKPLHTESSSYQKYLDQIVNLQQQLNTKYPFINFK